MAERKKAESQTAEGDDLDLRDTGPVIYSFNGKTHYDPDLKQYVDVNFRLSPQEKTAYGALGRKRRAL